jgi:two-component system sensor histidine kinase UhpB
MTSSQKSTLAFLCFGVGWIFLTDKFFLLISRNDLGMYSKFQMYKGLLFVILSSVLVFFVSYYLNKQITEANRYLKLSNQKLSILLQENKKHQQEISEAIIKAQEEERKQLGEELHDNINQILATTKLFLDIARENPLMQADLTQKSSQNISDVISELRKLSKSLSPPSLGDLGLIASLEDLLINICQAGKIEVNFYHDQLKEEEIAEDKKLIVYRIVQEQMNNILTHSQARNVIIDMKTFNGFLILKIQDDGRGFDPTKVSRGIGLKNIRSRSELYNGTMKLDTAPGEGCVLRVKFQL